MRPVARFYGRSAMSVLAAGLSCRQARSDGSLCGATGMVLGGARAYPLAHPPHPPTMKTRPTGVISERPGRGAIAFCYWRGRRVCVKPVEIVVTYLQSHVAVRTPLPRVAIKYPRLVPFSTRVWSFFPRVCFYRFPSPPLSISLFSLRKESEREEEQGETSIHGFLNCNKMYPRVQLSIHGFSVAQKTGRSQCWRGFAGVLTPIHASTGRNAYTSPTKVRNER